MASTINQKTGSIALEVLQNGVKYVGKGALNYIKEAMPVTTPIITESAAIVKDAGTSLVNTSRQILPSMRGMKVQNPFKNILSWFNQKESMFDDYQDAEHISFDGLDDLDDIPAVESEINQIDKSTNKLSQSIIESSHQMVESQIAATANMITTLDKQTSIIGAGFDKTNELLAKILETMTKNTATIIEENAALIATTSNQNTNMASTGRFNASEYRKMVSQNIENSPFGMVKAFLPMLMDPNTVKQFLTPETVASGMVSLFVNKKNSNLKKNLKALDNAINDTILSSLIRLGDSKNSGGIKGIVARMFGIDASRQYVDTKRSTFELKETSFDTLTKDAITSAIPGYLRKILVAVGGSDEIYDYRTRSFKTKSTLKKEYDDIVSRRNNLWNADDYIKNTLGTNSFSSMTYDLMLNRIGSMIGYGDITNDMIDKITSDPSFAEEFIYDLYKNKLKGKDANDAKEFAKRLTMLPKGFGKQNIKLQASRANVNRNIAGKNYVNDADKYGVDLSFINDNPEDDAEFIMKSYGRDDLVKKSSNIKYTTGKLTSINYTNSVLWEIYRRLNKGINVFQVGSKNYRDKKFKGFSELQPPEMYRPKQDGDIDTEGSGSYFSHYSDYEEIPTVDENGNELTKGERFAKWGKTRGGQLVSALFNGNENDVRKAFGDIFRDASGAIGSQAKRGISNINDKYGNAKGYIKHKLFGSSYEYDEINPETNELRRVNIGKNEKGGMFGFVRDEMKDMFNTTKSKASNWWKEVKGYFDYGDKDEDKSIKDKRKKLISTSVGALAGAGILGGPLGVLMGGIAGNALSAGGIGKKIKEKLFGRDEDGKAKGLFTKVFDKVTRPIEYQISKTINFIGGSLKKNIFGPISDLGLAIKERAMTHVDNAFHKFFLDPLKNAGKKLLGGIVKGAGFLGEKALNIGSGAFGEIQRAKFEAKTGIFGVLTEGAAKAVAGSKSGHWEYDEDGNKKFVKTTDTIKARSNARKNTVKSERSQFKGKDAYEKWNEEQDRKAASRNKRLSEYTSETEVASNTSDIAEEAKKTNANIEDVGRSMDELVNDTKSFHELGRHAGSIFTHDIHLEKQLDNIIVLLGGKAINRSSVTSGNKTSTGQTGSNNFAGSAVTAATNLIMSGDSVSNDEERGLAVIIDEASKGKPNGSKISQKLKELTGIQKISRKSKTEEKESFTSKLFKTISSGFGSIAGNFGSLLKLTAGLVGLSDLKSFYSNVVKGDMNFSEWWGEKSAIGTSIRGLMDISKFVGTYGGAVVDGISGGIEAFTKFIPGIPTISPPRVSDLGPFSGLATGILGGLYLKGISAVANVVQAASSIKNAASNTIGNIIDLIPGGKGTVSTLAKSALPMIALGSTAKAIMSGGTINYENTDAAGNSIINNAETNASYAPTIRMASHLAAGTRTPEQIFPAMKYLKSFGKKLATPSSSNTLSLATDIIDNTSGNVIGNTVANVSDSGAASKAVNFCKKALEGVKTFLVKHKKIAKVAGGAGRIVSKIDDIISAITSKGKNLFQKFANKVVQIITRGTTQEASKAATAGIAMGVFGLVGAASGVTAAANIFNVRESDVTPGMKTVAGIVVAMLNAVPGLWALELVDLVISPLRIRSILAELIYNIVGDGENLEEARGKMDKSRNDYNSKFNKNLSSEEYNDMVNTGGLIDRLLHGKTKIDENGDYVFDEGGAALKKGGLTSIITGREKEYLKDANGNVLKDQYGNSIVAKDKYGRDKYKDKKWGNYVGDFFGNVGRFFGGGDIYETDENGNAIVDENGEYVIKGKESNIFGKTSEFMKQAGWYDENDGFIKSTMKITGKLTESILNPFSLVSDALKVMNNNNYELDENGEPLLDEEGKPIRKKDGILNFVTNAVGKINSFITHPFKTILETLTGSEDKKKVEEIGKKQDKGFWDSVMEGLSKLGQSQLEVRAGLGGPTAEDMGWASPGSSKSDNSKLNWVSPDQATSDNTNEFKASSFNIKIPNSSKPGGNPLSTPFKISNEYGNNDKLHRGKHHGIDIVPADGYSTDNVKVGSRFSGTVVKIKNNVPDDDTARQTKNGDWIYQGRNETGNMVAIQTDDGFIVKNMHLKAGSIPDNLKEGSKINVGDTIGMMGSTGYSTAPHLHYQIEDAEGNPVDPTSSVRNAKELTSTINKKQTDSANRKLNSRNVNESTSSSSTISDDVSSASSSDSTIGGSGPLAQLLAMLKDAGTRFLNELTGGLFGGDTSSSDAGSTYSASSSSTGDTQHTGTVNGNDINTTTNMMTTTPNSSWVEVVRAVKQAVASQKPIYYTEAGSFEVEFDAGGKHIKMRPDCSGLVGAMLEVYGVKPGGGTNTTSASLDNDNGIPDGFDTAKWPGWENLIEGDILVTGGNHTEVFGYNEGNTHYVYSGGQTSTLQAPGVTKSGHSKYNRIWRCRETGSSFNLGDGAIDAGALGINNISMPGIAAIKGGQTGVDNNVPKTSFGTKPSVIKISSPTEVRDRLRKMGYNDKAVAGIMGVWGKESDNKHYTVEGDNVFKDAIDTALVSNEALDSYVTDKLWPALEKNVSNLHKDAYVGRDGHYYPGIGLAQWTGPRAQDLLEFAMSKKKDWRDFDTQMQFFEHEMAINKRDVTMDQLNNAETAADAAELFARQYEGTSSSSWINARRENANKMYELYANEGVGGPTDSSINISSYRKPSNTKKQQNTSPAPIVNFKRPNITNNTKSPIEVVSNERNNIDMSQVVLLLNQVIQELHSINGNTDASNSLLSSIDSKGFQDKGVRDTLNSFGKTNRKNPSRHVTSNPNAHRLVASLARP